MDFYTVMTQRYRSNPLQNPSLVIVPLYVQFQKPENVSIAQTVFRMYFYNIGKSHDVFVPFSFHRKSDGHEDGRTDMKCNYWAACVSYLIGDWSGIDSGCLIANIMRSQVGTVSLTGDVS